VDNFDFNNNLESSYRVKIEGRLLDDEDDAEKPEEEAKPAADAEDADKMDTDGPAKPKPKPNPRAGQRYRFSHFFKALTVEFDRNGSRPPPDTSVEWKKPDRVPPASAGLLPAADFDEFTFKRNGDENTNITINLYRQEDPPSERFELSPPLAEVVDMKEATRSEIVMGLWAYIKMMNLQEDEEKRNFRCDELLRRVSWISPPSDMTLQLLMWPCNRWLEEKRALSRCCTNTSRAT
jgi:SWI/SNF-related matrix-associated actin-dependent regulator of chromatin subfamily D